MIPLVCFINNDQFDMLQNIIKMIHMTIRVERFYVIYTLQEGTTLDVSLPVLLRNKNLSSWKYQIIGRNVLNGVDYVTHVTQFTPRIKLFNI
jgi:hypothetical protein